MLITSMVLREEKEEEKVVSEDVRKSKRMGIPVFYQGCYRSSCVYYINMYFSFFSVKIYVKCIDKFRLVYFEFYAQCCLNGVKDSKKRSICSMCLYII